MAQGSQVGRGVWGRGRLRAAQGSSIIQWRLQKWEISPWMVGGGCWIRGNAGRLSRAVCRERGWWWGARPLQGPAAGAILLFILSQLHFPFPGAGSIPGSFLLKGCNTQKTPEQEPESGLTLGSRETRDWSLKTEAKRESQPEWLTSHTVKKPPASQVSAYSWHSPYS